ncbi:glycine cleavage system aminomethyltransferase GcvT [Gimesia aquarii]|uniref:Aminomethyltransferase n=1 Tax=Gimesia aquarii TaxID=2527964 RepID=A0A517X284_9PLAN|nr:glycine cleavage system aminomethyltransferase GcvT [Gimesia aquarii]QDU11617.1 Glycine cleavage system T protein [Gimesia aquarii]
MSDSLLFTACHAWHVAHGGRMVDFAGWDMPLLYSNITEEHHAVRKTAGLFDIAHMGRLFFTGPDACRFLDTLLTNNVESLKLGQIRYSLVTNESGGILDDVLVYRFSNFYMLVVNASNRLKIVDWIEQQRLGFDVHVEDQTTEKFMLALQGPESLNVLYPITDANLSEIKYYFGVETKVLGVDALVSRTGYTGEDGFEVVLDQTHAVTLWERLIADGQAVGLVPTGLGCRDTLRLEAAMPLYGHELNEQIDPFTAGLNFAVKLKGADFIGKEALIAAKARDDKEIRVGIILDGKRAAREGSPLFQGDQQVGTVTSGSFSPTLEAPIGMAYVKPSFAEAGQTLEADIRGKRYPVKVVALPFYQRDT